MNLRLVSTLIIVGTYAFSAKAAGLISASPKPLETPLSYFREIELILEKDRPKNVAELLRVLPAEWKKEYSLVYQSNSLQTASIEKPRVIFMSPDHQFYLAFTGHQSDETQNPSDDRIEMIESYGKGSQKFAEIFFSERQAKINSNPTICASCHQGTGIIQSYPHWVGFYGSEHNGIAYGERRGTSKIPTFEFEQNGLSQFIQKGRDDPRYRNLPNIEGLTLSKLAAQNTILGTSILGRIQTQQTDLILSQKKSIPEVNEAYLFSRWVGDDFTTPLPELLQEKYRFYTDQFERLRQEYITDVMDSEKRRLDSLIALVDQLGTKKDREIASKIEFFQRSGNFPSPRTDLGIPTDNVFNFFATQPMHSVSGIYYRYLKNQTPNDYPLPVGSSVSQREFRGVAGTTFGNVFTHLPPGFENGGGEIRFNARIYRDMAELYAWISDFVKETEYEAIQPYAELNKGIQLHLEAYLSILMKSPIVNKEDAKVFLNIRSMSPETRAHFEKFLLE
jgi:hypothetical protein